MNRRDHREVQDGWVIGLAAILVIGIVGGLKWWAQHKASPAAVNPAPPRVQSPNQASDPTGSSMVDGDHDVLDDTRCLAQTAPRTQPPQRIHKWVDQNGVVHFSDQAPDDRAMSSKLVTLTDTQPIEVRIETRSAEMPPHATSAAIADAVAIGKILRNALAVRVDGGLRLRVVFVGTDAAFRQAAPGSTSTSGAYLPGMRTIVVRTRRSPDETLAVLRHEITHALIHEWVGRTPKALNEGMAEYFEHFDAQGMGGIVDPNRYARRMANAAPKQPALHALRTLLAADHSRFHGDGEQSNYTRSMALISTLMASPQGRRSLSIALAEQRKQTCTPIDLAAVLHRTWPSGLSSLATHWQQHQRMRGHEVHAY
jgi:hypothetical protein